MKRTLFISGILIGSILMVSFFWSGSRSQSNPAQVLKGYTPQLEPPLQDALADYDDFLQSAIDNGESPGLAVAIVKDSSIIYIKGFGVKSVEDERPVDVNTVFRLGSVSKCFASILAADLVEDHVIQWDDPVTKYLPDFSLKKQEQTQSLQIGHLLSHTTGLPYHAYTNLIEEGYDLDYLIAQLKEVDPIGEAGKIYSYQNVAYAIIDRVIAAATGKTYEQEMKEQLFGPLRMSDASLSYDAMLANKDIALPHLRRGGKWKQIPISETYYNVQPAGGMNASITDMAKWLRAMLGFHPNIISQASLQAVFQPRIRATAKNRNFNLWNRIRRSYYGYGWRVLQFTSDTLMYHGGYVNGYRSEVAILPTEKLAVCVLTNAPSNLADIAIPTFLRTYQERKDKFTITAAAPTPTKP